METELSAEQLALLEFMAEPQSLDSVSIFTGSDKETAMHEINKLKYRGLVKDVKGPTYDFWQINEKGKELLNI